MKVGTASASRASIRASGDPFTSILSKWPQISDPTPSTVEVSHCNPRPFEDSLDSSATSLYRNPRRTIDNMLACLSDPHGDR